MSDPASSLQIPDENLLPPDENSRSSADADWEPESNDCYSDYSDSESDGSTTEDSEDSKDSDSEESEATDLPSPLIASRLMQCILLHWFARVRLPGLRCRHSTEVQRDQGIGCRGRSKTPFPPSSKPDSPELIQNISWSHPCDGLSGARLHAYRGRGP